MRISREISLDAGHRIQHHGGPCKGLHGHRYRIVASVETGSIQSSGAEKDMLMDFGRLKDVMMKTIHEPCDHALLLECDDPLIETLTVPNIARLARERQYQYEPGWSFDASYGDHRIRVLRYAPTAERLAQHWAYWLSEALESVCPTAILVELDVWETPNCRARWVP